MRMCVQYMTLPLSYRVLFCLLCLGQIVGCQSEQHEELRGGLYFALGQYLAELDLRSGDINIETNFRDAEILQISPQRDERLLLSVFGSINQQDRHRLVLYDLDTRQALTIANGRNGHYLPGTEVLVYDDGSKLILAERYGDDWQKAEVAEHAYNAALLVAPISATRFLYAIAGQPMHLYDIVSGRTIELTKLSQRCRLDASLWDQERNSLLCRQRRDDGNYEYVMVGLDGAVGQSLPLPESRRLLPLAFLPDQNALILTEEWQGMLSDRKRHAVWVYRFDSGAFYRLVDNQYLGRSVVYAHGQGLTELRQE